MSQVAVSSFPANSRRGYVAFSLDEVSGEKRLAGFDDGAMTPGKVGENIEWIEKL
jgi:hypothetical protein